MDRSMPAEGLEPRRTVYKLKVTPALQALAGVNTADFVCGLRRHDPQAAVFRQIPPHCEMRELRLSAARNRAESRRIIFGDVEGRERWEYYRVETTTDIESATVALQTARNRQWSKAIAVVYDARPAVERLAGDEICDISAAVPWR
jgi:hypothetical protein